MTSNTQTDSTLIFEYPAKPQVRSFLRLESLFKRFERNRLATHPDNHLFALKILLEIVEILEHGDTRSELTKELARLSEQFSILRKNPEVDVKKLDTFLVQINQLKDWVFGYEGRFGEKIRKHPFIENVRYRTSIPGGYCQFDCPELFLFLNKEYSERQQLLLNWLENIKGIKTSVEVILKLLRDTTKWQHQEAPMGTFLIEATDPPFQLIRVKLEKTLHIFPEFSVGKHRSTIIFKSFNQDYKKIPQQKQVPFELACCH
ncbi:cell division protein ZapD [Aliikangiella maris]|uniref:Cell division protein ZapD n=2 Tax=Aliikangiella maris TaxID=3162458 RepID=A0ABV2BRU2_9GAMM